MNLYHYFEKGNKPFLTLTDLTDEKAKKVQDSLKKDDNVYSRRDNDGKYMFFRRIVESNVRQAFINKGGKPIRKTPIYFIFGESHAKNSTIYKQWFNIVDYIEIPINSLVTNTVSFTYGDSFIENHPQYRDQEKYSDRVHTYEEILNLVSCYGYPQYSVKEDSPFWVPRYIEAQLWSNDTIIKYITK